MLAESTVTLVWSFFVILAHPCTYKKIIVGQKQEKLKKLQLTKQNLKRSYVNFN